jgi:hypothetical protein
MLCVMKILWLAVADARGHLMRAHLMRQILAEKGVKVDIVTTSPEGVAFLAALGTPAALLSGGHQIRCDERQNMRRGRTQAGVFRYVLSPARRLRDLRQIEELARGAALVIDDSLHPALLLAPLRRRPLRVVHLYGENTLHAVEHALERRRRPLLSRRPRSLLDEGCARAVRRVLGAAFGSIEHSLSAPAAGEVDRASRRHRLPPLVAAPGRSRGEVRAELGVPEGARLAVVYLNPYFKDPALATALEQALRREGFFLHAVGEGFAGRPGWLSHDPRLADVIAAADLLVSAASMGSLGHVRLHGTPLLALRTAQPEQLRNLACWGEEGGLPIRQVDCGEGGAALDCALAEAIGALGAVERPARRDPGEGVRALHALWAGTILDLLDEAGRDQVRSGRHGEKEERTS